MKTHLTLTRSSPRPRRPSTLIETTLPRGRTRSVLHAVVVNCYREVDFSAREADACQSLAMRIRPLFDERKRRRANVAGFVGGETIPRLQEPSPASAFSLVILRASALSRVARRNALGLFGLKSTPHQTRRKDNDVEKSGKRRSRQASFFSSSSLSAREVADQDSRKRPDSRPDLRSASRVPPLTPRSTWTSS